MNSWLHHCFFRRTDSAGLRPSVWRAVLCALLLLCAGLFLPVEVPVLGTLPPMTSNSRPEYICTPPQSRVINGTADFKVSVEFAWNSVEPISSLYPVVYWYRNGNYIASVTSSIKNKTTSATGASYYECWNPYDNSGKGLLYQANTLDGTPGGFKRIVWKNELAVSLKDQGADKTAVYTAYIEKLEATTPPAQIVLTPAQVLGLARPTLTVVRSPKDATAEVGGGAILWGDAQSHVNGLLQNPFGVAVDSQGMVYVADSLNHAIRRVTPGGKGTTVAGMDGAILDDTGKSLKSTDNYDPVLGQITGEIVIGETVPSILKLSSVELVKEGSRLTVTGGEIFNSLDAPVTLPASVTVATVNQNTDLLGGGSIATTLQLDASRGTLTFDVNEPVAARGIYMERPPTSGPPNLTTKRTVQELQKPADKANWYRNKSVKEYYNKVAENDREPLFDTPEALVTAEDGSVFVADTKNNAVRRIFKDKEAKTYVQTICWGTQQFLYDSASAGVWGGTLYTNAAKLPIGSGTVSLSAPRGIVYEGSMTDTTGNNPPVLYVLDFSGIHKITLNYSGQNANAAPGSCVCKITYIGGLSKVEGWQDLGSVSPEAARLYAPRGMVVTRRREDGNRMIYVADTVNHVIRKFTLNNPNEEDAAPQDWSSDIVAGFVGAKATTTDGDGYTGYFPPVIVPGCRIGGGTWIAVPSTVGILPDDKVLINSGTYQVKRIAAGSLIVTPSVPSVVGSGTVTYAAKVIRAASPEINVSRLTYPSGLAMDRRNNLYFTEMGSHNLRRVVLDDVNPGVCARVETVAGQSKAGPTDGGTGEGTGKNASFYYPASLAYDATGDQESFLVADSANSCIRRITTTARRVTLTGSGSALTPTKITNLSSISGVQPLMRVSGLNIPPGASIVSVDVNNKTMTLNLPITNTVDSTQVLTLEQDTFTSGTALGYPGYSGNRDFANECAEYSYQWLKYGIPLANESTVTGAKTYVSGADGPFLSLNYLRTTDSGPYELKVSNVFNISVDTDQAALYVVPKVDGKTDSPAFIKPGYAQLVASGASALRQLRSDQGDMNFALRAYIAPADTVSYQWQVLTPGNGWVSLNDSLTQPIIDTEVSELLGRDGSGGLALEGTNTPMLKITGYQKSLVTKGGALPAATFRVQAFPLSGGSQVTKDQTGVTVGSFTSNASFAPVMTGTAAAIQVKDGTQDVVLADAGSQAKFAATRFVGGSIALTLTAQDKFSAFPLVKTEDKLNPDFRVRYQWMQSAKLPSDPTASPSLVAGSTGDYEAGSPPKLDLQFDGKQPLYYFVRYWVGSGYPEDNDPSTVIGRPVYGNYVKLTKVVSASAGTIKYAEEPGAGEPLVKIVYVNGASFTLDALVDSASGTPKFTWSYLKWGDPATNWKTISGGTASSAAIYAGTYGAVADRLGTGAVTSTLTSGSLTITGFEKLPDLKTGFTPNKDLSGLYRLEARVADGGSVSTAQKYWVVAMRQQPSAYGTDATLYSLNGGPQTLLAVDSGSLTSVSLRANVLLPLPDQIPMHTIYGGTLIDGKTDFGVLANSDTSAMASGMYSWYRGTTPLSDGKNSANGNEVKINGGTLTVTNIQEKDLGTYTLRVSNKLGTITNLGPSTATASGISLKGWSLVTNGLPSVLAPPSAKDTGGIALSGGTLTGGTLVYRVALGQTVALEIPVKSSYGLKYFWMFSKTGTGNWTNLPSATQNKDSKYFIRSATLQDSGVYRVNMNFYTDSRFTNGFDIFKGDTTKWPRLKLVVEPVPDPAIPKLTALGSTVTLSAGANTLLAGGTAKLAVVSLKSGTSFLSSGTTSFFTYQWKKDGVSLVGENKETLTLPKLTKSQAGSYTVDVSSVSGTATSKPLLLAVSSKTVREALYPVNFVNLNDIKYTISPSVANGVPAGTALTLTGMSSRTQTLLGWRVWDAAGNAWDLPARNAQFTMPNQAVTISPTVGRPSVGWYTGFLSLEKPWGDLEWDIYPLMGLDPTLRGLYSKTPSASQVRGYFQAMISVLGVLSGKVFIEGKSYPFTTTMSVAPDGTYSGPIKIQATLADRTPWLLTGNVSLNMGLRKTCTLTKGSKSITVPSGTGGLMETMSVSGYGIPDGTIITGIDTPKPGSITVSNAATISTKSVNTAGVPVVFGSNLAALDNVMHMTLNDVVLELTPPVMKSGLSLYSAGACNAGVYNTLSKFITAKTGRKAPRTPIYTSAVYRFGVKDANSVLGRGGVLSTNISDLGYAIITGYLPNGAPISFAGYGGRACYTENTQDTDPLDVFLPVDSSGGTDLIGIATRVMQETLERHTGSISIPIWSTSPKGDKPEEPLFGALLISDLSVHGCLGVLNAVPLAGGTVMVGSVKIPSGNISTASEYTHNYVQGYLYDPTIDPNWPEPQPFTQTARISVSSKAPMDDATSYKLEDLTAQSLSLARPLTGIGTLHVQGRGFVLTTSQAVVDAGTIISAFSDIVINAPTGLFTGSFVEKTDRYVGASGKSGPLWASVDAQGSDFRLTLSVPFYGVTIQGGDASVLGLSGGAVGFMMRGTTKPDSLKNTLGNGYQDPSLVIDPNKQKPTFRTEALNINVFEPN